MLRTCLAPCAVVLLACATSPGFDPAAHDAALRDAEVRMQMEEVDEALIIVDGVLKEDPENRRARVLLARGSLALSLLGRSNTPGLIADAIRNYELVLEMDDQDPDSWVELARAYLMNSQYQEGLEAAVRGASQLREADADRQRIAAAMLVGADNQMQIFVAARREELQSPDEVDANGIPIPSRSTLELGSAALNTLYQIKREIPGEAYRNSAQIYQWLGKQSDALEELERGLDAAPQEQELHFAYHQLHFDMGRHRELVAAYRRLSRAKPGVTLVDWFLGQSQLYLADRYRRQGDREQAIDSYEAARQVFDDYLVEEPRYRESAEERLAVCHLSLARLALDSGQLDRAIELYRAAYADTVRVAEQDENGAPRIFDSFGGNYIGGLDMVGRAIGNGDGPDALAERLAHYEWIVEMHPDQFGFVYNNAGFIARDLGIAIETQGTAAATREALDLFEKSYAFYEKAVALSPDDPRIVNDCGVMLVYHLKRDYDRAEELFRVAIESGEAQLDVLPASVSREEREALEEALGDGYQNLAVMMSDLGRPFVEYRDHLGKAVMFFPYQRRDAAYMLANNGRRPPTAAPIAPDRQASQDRQDPRKAAFDKIAEEASAKAQQGDLDGALLVLDRAIRDMDGYAPFHYYLGLYSFQYATRSRDSGGSLIQVESLYADATRQLKKSVELDGEPLEPRLTLANAYYETGEFALAAEEIGTVLTALREADESSQEKIQEGLLLQAKAASRVYIDAKQAQRDDTENLLAARGAYRALEEANALDEAMVQSWSTMERWAGANADALEVVGRATRRFPESGVLHGQLIELADQNNLGQAAVEILKGRRDAFGLWYLGRVRFSLAHEEWLRSQPDVAVEELDRAIENFTSSKTDNPAYTDSCEQWIALCLGKQGIVLLSANRMPDAEAALLKAAATRPDRIEEPLGNNNTVKRALMIVADRYFQNDDLNNAQRIYGEAAEAVPEDVDFLNNYGLFARDYGVRLERREQPDEAMALFEASYEAYTKASQLEPQNVRLLNDRALMLIHHLKRDWDISLQCLELGVELGEVQFHETPPANPDDRQVLEEALGDCYENLGLYNLDHTGDLVKAEAFYKKALEFYPKQARPGTRRGLRQVEARKKTDGVKQR